MVSTTQRDPLLESAAAVFRTAIEADKPAPTVEPDELARPLIVRHVGTRVIEYTRENEARKSTLQIFASRAGEGPHFSVFANAGLNSQVKKAGAAPCLLRYVGKEQQDGRDVHVWSLSSGSRAADIGKLRATPAWVEREVEFDRAIERATVAERERRDARRAQGGSSGSPEGPPHDDDDAPRY